MLRTELLKILVYRTTLFAVAGALALTTFWDISLLLRGQNAPKVFDSGLAFGGIVLPLVWFTVPILVISGDTHHGTLWPALVSQPRPHRILVSKWIASVIVALVSAVTAWIALFAVVQIAPAGAELVPVMFSALPRLCTQAALCVTLGFALFLLTGYQGAPWIILGLMVWIHFMERVFSSTLQGKAGMIGMPFRLVDFWIRHRWVGAYAENDAVAFLPLTLYCVVTAVIAGSVFLFFSDSSGRTWGRKQR
ncbi:hypothetical protein SAMN05421595_2762 [Austwickia chelonae]|nr:hypothetical protein SAMN05421595_2762 [Austwickia chelonae]